VFPFRTLSGINDDKIIAGYNPENIEPTKIMIAVLIAMLLAYSLIPLFSSIVGKKIPFEIIFLPEFWMWFSIIILVGSIFSGFR
jgi:hypothetical protein